MTYDSFAALAAFALATSVTPGPNNLMLMASGANFGFRRTLPHMLGIGVGCVVMILGVGTGVMALFDLWPPSYRVLKVASIAYMLWLAWKIARAAAPKGGVGTGRPMTFLQAAAFQWVNPKAWAMALGAITVYAPDRSVAAIAMVALAFGAVNLPSVSVWALAGTALRGWLADPARLRVFNWTMAALLVASLAAVL